MKLVLDIGSVNRLDVVISNDEHAHVSGCSREELMTLACVGALVMSEIKQHCDVFGVTRLVVTSESCWGIGAEAVVAAALERMGDGRCLAVAGRAAGALHDRLKAFESRGGRRESDVDGLEKEWSSVLRKEVSHANLS